MDDRPTWFNLPKSSLSTLDVARLNGIQDWAARVVGGAAFSVCREVIGLPEGSGFRGRFACGQGNRRVTTASDIPRPPALVHPGRTQIPAWTTTECGGRGDPGEREGSAALDRSGCPPRRVGVFLRVLRASVVQNANRGALTWRRAKPLGCATGGRGIQWVHDPV